MLAKTTVKMKALLLASLALGILFPLKRLYPQEIYELDLQKSIEIAKQKSHQMLILNQVLAQAGFELKAATSRLKTHIDLNFTVPDYTETIRQFEDTAGVTFYPVQQLRYNGSVVVSQPLPNRMELRENEIQIELSKLEIKRIKSEGMVNGDITAYYDLIGTDQRTLPYPFTDAVGNSWQQMRDRPGNFGVALRIRIPIFDWGENRSMVNAALSGLEVNKRSYDQEKINIEREIRNSVKQLKSSLRRLQLLERNVELAEKSFNISRQRFSDGDIDSQSLALDRTRLNAAYQSHLNAYISYKLLIADIMRKTFYDFENGKPVV